MVNLLPFFYCLKNETFYCFQAYEAGKLRQIQDLNQELLDNNSSFLLVHFKQWSLPASVLTQELLRPLDCWSIPRSSKLCHLVMRRTQVAHSLQQVLARVQLTLQKPDSAAAPGFQPRMPTSQCGGS